MTKSELIRLRNYIIDSIAAWGPDNPLSAEAETWVTNINEDLDKMMTEHVGLTMKTDGTKSFSHIDMDFALDDGATAFWVWWDNHGEKVFTRWCANSKEYNHVVETYD